MTSDIQKAHELELHYLAQYIQLKGTEHGFDAYRKYDAARNHHSRLLAAYKCELYEAKRCVKSSRKR